MERIFRRAAALRKYKSGVFAPYMGTLVNDWCQEGYSVERVQQMLSVLFEFGCWTKNRRIPIDQLTVDHAKLFIRRKHFRVRGMLAPMMRLLEVLVARGCIKALRPPLSAIEQVLEKFSAYLADERSCAQSTVRSHKDAARLFLVWKFGSKALKYPDIGPADFPGFIGSTAKGRGHSAYLGCGVRAFLRFLLWDGRVSFDLSGAVPPARRWRYSSIPRNLTADQVKRILASCDRSTRCGRRSYAVLLLLSRLGLRSVEIRRILLGDVDWKEGVLTVRGKGGKLSTLPLPHDVGVAMIRYLRKDRGKPPNKFLFQKIHPGGMPMGRACPGTIVKAALERAGVKAPTKGTHQFRHTLATNMLAKGATLPEIGSVLGHASPATTFIYTKVDLVPLRRMAMPWPGGHTHEA